jgi:hypothetical protein
MTMSDNTETPRPAQTVALAADFLHLLAAEPTLLPPASASDGAREMDHRRLDEVHSCLRCGKRAQQVFIAHTKIGPRWLDLCIACRHWLEQLVD